MKLKMGEILLVNNTLEKLATQEVEDVKVVYKLYKMKRALEDVVYPIQQSLNGADKDKINQLLSEEEEVSITDHLTVEELMPFKLSMVQLANLQPVLEEE